MAEQPPWLTPWHPAIQAVDAAPLWVSLAAPASVETMVQRVIQAHTPEAELYARHRCWTLLLWQPVFLSLAAVNDGGGTLDLTHLNQRYQHGSVYGLQQLPGLEPMADFRQRLQQQAHLLRAYAQQAFSLIQPQIRCKPQQLWGLLADLVWLALQAGWHPGRQRHDWYQQGQRWQQTVVSQPIKGQRDLHFLVAENRWRIQRGSCCFHYLNPGDECCEGCPKTARKQKNMMKNIPEKL